MSAPTIAEGAVPLATLPLATAVTGTPEPLSLAPTAALESGDADELSIEELEWVVGGLERPITGKMPWHR